MSTALVAGTRFLLQCEESWSSNLEFVIAFVEEATIESQDYHVFVESPSGRRFWLRPRYVGASMDAASGGSEVVVDISEPATRLPNLQQIGAAYIGIGTIRAVKG